jgi:hypothetical protein
MRVVSKLNLCGAVLALVVGACSSSSSSGGGGGSGSTQFSGPISGQTFNVADSIAFDDSSSSRAELELKITDYAGACSTLMNNDSHKGNGNEIKVELRSIGSPVAVGDFTFVSPAPTSGTWLNVFELRHYDGTCNETTVAMATAGTISLKTLTATQATGTFNVTIGGSQITGSFTTSMCTKPVDAGASSCL